MLRMILKRVAVAIPLLLGVSLAVFALTTVSPTDPARAILGEGATPESVRLERHQLGLDQSFLHRYWNWLDQALHGNLGRSWYGNVPVTTKIAQGLPVTAALVLSSLALTAVIAIPIGLHAGLHVGRTLDRVANIVAGFCLAMPEFWVALLLILVLSEKLRWLPGIGATSITGDVVSDVKHLILPVVALSLPQICALYRQTRASAAQVAGQDYIRTARAGGASDRNLVWTRIAKNALVPSVTLLGLQLGRMIGVAAVVESVCGMHGIGSIAVQAALGSDIPIVLGVVLVTAIVVMAANLLTDVACYYLAPKARQS
jgi:peptide/nickel transport system permease protein